MKRMICSMVIGMATATGAWAQTPPTPTAAPVNTGRDVAVFNMAKVQKEFKKWEVFTKELQTLRTNEAKKLAEVQTQIQAIKEKLANPAEPQKEMLEQQGVALARKLQDMDAEIRKSIDKASTNYLSVLHDDIRRVVQAVAETNKFGVVMAYPDATTDEERKSPVYFDMKLRPSGAMPFYVSPTCDMTDTIIATLNKFCPPTSVIPAAATAPASPAPAPAPGLPAAPRP